MKKLFLLLVAITTLIGFSQTVFLDPEDLFANSETGELVQWTPPTYTDANGRVLEKAKCRCYQGPDGPRRNKENNPQGSCCWVHPSTSTYPYCTYGCI